VAFRHSFYHEQSLCFHVLKFESGFLEIKVARCFYKMQKAYIERWGSHGGCESWNIKAVHSSLLLNCISFQAFLKLHSDICLHGYSIINSIALWLSLFTNNLFRTVMIWHIFSVLAIKELLFQYRQHEEYYNSSHFSAFIILADNLFGLCI